MKSKMNVIRGIIIASLLSMALTSYGQISDVDIKKQTLKKDLCTQAKGPITSIPNALTHLLGEPLKCVIKNYEQTEYGLYTEVVLEWTNLKLTVQYQPPETAIFIIKTTDNSLLTDEWYQSMRDKMIDKGFDMNWKFDEFPGPTGEHYTSKDSGNNAQLWLERDSNKAISWLRFSYAL